MTCKRMTNCRMTGWTMTIWRMVNRRARTKPHDWTHLATRLTDKTTDRLPDGRRGVRSPHAPDAAAAQEHSHVGETRTQQRGPGRSRRLPCCLQRPREVRRPGLDEREGGMDKREGVGQSAGAAPGDGVQSGTIRAVFAVCESRLLGVQVCESRLGAVSDGATDNTRERQTGT